MRAASGNRFLEYIAESEFGLVYYDLLNRLDRSPDAQVTFELNGVVHEDQTAQTLAAEREAMLHPRWFRKYFHFQRVPLENPPQCF